ncbi:MAG TPA: DUF1592 domain-containing protein [Polyangiaceae bacterium]|nr:DUF1592 domain-containing protein [Polyangiaceae bacterium]
MLLVSASACACTPDVTSQPGGNVAGSPMQGGGTGGQAGGTGGAGSTPQSCTAPSPGASPIRRLTRFEYSNTLHDLLGTATRPGDALPPEQKGNGFGNDAASLSTTRLLVDAYHAQAHDLASKVTADTAALAKLSACDTASQGEDACADQFVTAFGGKAFRRPLEAAEHDALLGIYKSLRPNSTYSSALAGVIEAVLQLPQFLYRVELGTATDAPNLSRPTSHEMASRLSYLLWGSMPDQTLLDAASSDQLATKEQVLAQAQRMLEDPRAREVVRFFHDTLYGINGLDGLQRDATFFPTYTPALATLFRQETEAYLDSIVWDGGGDFGTIFTGNYSFVNETLAKFYGIPGVVGDAFQRVNLDPTKRAGILTQASLLTTTTPGSHTNPVARGKFIFTKLLCGTVPDPPPALMVKEPEADPTRTTRERFMAHRTNPSCAACHSMLDGIGFGLDHYDGVGLWQDLDNGKPVDDTGNVPSGDAAGDFKGAVELGQKIANSQDARSCYVGQWLNFAYGRLEQAGDACTRQQLVDAFKSSNGNVKQLLIALTQTDDFLYRPAASP